MRKGIKVDAVEAKSVRDSGRVHLRSAEAHWGPRFSMQVCQQDGSWSVNVEAAAERTESKIDIVIV